MKIKSKKIINLDNPIPVYDIEVANEDHNFALSNGVVVHNCVNALSNEYHVWSKITREKLLKSTDKVKKLCQNLNLSDKYYHLFMSKGLLKKEEVESRDGIKSRLGVDIPKDAVTIVAFNPDESIMESRYAEVPDSLRFVKHIVQNQGKSAEIYYNGKEFTDIFTPFKYNFSCKIKSRYEGAKNPEVTILTSLEVDKEEFRSFPAIGSVNGLVCNSGHHIKLATQAFENAISKIYNKDFRGYSMWGIHFSVIFMCPEPAFASQTKERCTGISGIDASCMGNFIDKYMQVIQENKELFDLHVARVLNYISTLTNLSKLDLIKSKVAITSEDSRAGTKIPLILNDCTSKKREECELFICEGNSALGTIRPVRNVKIHACFPLRGKPLNTSDVDIEEALDNAEICGLINAIGTGVDDYFSLAEVRYGKIIILADSDSDKFCHRVEKSTCKIIENC